MIREAAFGTAIKHNVDMIFTFVVAYDMPEDIEYLNNLRTMFENSGGTFSFVELEADLETRLERNVSPHRLASKFSKNDIERSTKDLINTILYTLYSLNYF